jgi:hypothetical protein
MDKLRYSTHMEKATTFRDLLKKQRNNLEYLEVHQTPKIIIGVLIQASIKRNYKSLKKLSRFSFSSKGISIRNNMS